MQLEGVNSYSVSEEILWMLQEGAAGLHLFAAAHEWSFTCARQ